MGVVDELLRARAEFERGDWASAFAHWSAVDPDGLTPEDLESAGSAAQLLGRRDDAVDRFRRAFDAWTAAGEVAAAARVAFRLSMVLRVTSDHSAASAWLARGERLVADLPDGSLEAGYLTFSRMFTHLGQGRYVEALACAEAATEAGRRHGDAGLVAVGLCAQGRIAIYGGRIPDGISFLDESMLEATSHALEPILLGNVYCTAIEGCQEVSDFRRVAEWTHQLHRWCVDQSGLVAFTGQCALHRGQLMRARGAWGEALEELSAAIERYRLGGSTAAIGQASCERGDLLRLRGDLAGADAAYQLSAEHGYDPQPGAALLWLARGADGAAVAAVRRLLAEPGPSVARSRVLPAAVDVLVAVHDTDAARECAAELEGLAASFGSEVLAASAAAAWGRVELASNDPAGALPYLRRAHQAWVALEMPYEAALALTATGRALIALGDAESARTPLASARQAFAALGARPDVEAIDRLTAPGSRPAGLSEREIEVLRLVAAGRSNAEIAAELVLSDRTVARHLSNIFTKIGVGSRTGAAAFAFEHDLV
ncbi:LuxR C-terminal-related transcriptional regulator [Terrabacter sp. GCM10028922]|uniref:LuxR C-terminal-related transcriptional regulator n=1 Tax=Terrabacter sp. GCM10028922 TaxID=3273428 RepID=UPI00361D961B